VLERNAARVQGVRERPVGVGAGVVQLPQQGQEAQGEAVAPPLHLNANRAAAYYGVPTARVVEIGIEVEI
jgi:hypothetical protein